MKARFLKRSWSRSSSGDFPGPVLAVVSVPFYSGDRQRVLVPRGAQVIGTAWAVANQDQSRLAVSFHRLILPDGRSVSLEFHGLNQLGEGALRDQVDRHYFSMFAAVGAVGVLSGLTAARGNPYEGGVAGFQAGAGQGLGQAATRILDRFLNRLPTTHHSCRAPAPHLVHFRCAGSPAHPRRMKMKMHKKALTVLLLVPVLIVLTTTPAYALFGSILAGIQRAQMIVNQGVQIYKDTMAKITLDGQLTQMTDQFAHLKEQALGSVGALTDPFTDLASAPAEFIGVGLSWKNDFTGVAAELADSVEQMGETGKSFTQSWRTRLSAADTVTESDILGLYGNYRPEIGAKAASGYLAKREEGDKQLVLGHAMSDAAANLMTAAREAVEAYEGLRTNTNTSNTALAQSQVAGAVTQGNLTAAMAQLMAFQAAKEAAEDYEREIARREALAEWVAARQQSEIAFAAQQAGLDARRDSMREGLLFRIHPAYGGADQ